MYIYILKIVGVFIIIAVLAFAGTLFMNVSRLKEEIEAEKHDLGEE